MNSKLMIFAAALLASTPVMAATNSNFTGPRVGISVGLSDVTNRPDANDITYNADAGFDVPVGDRVTVGVQGTLTNIFDRNRVLGAGARVGFAVTPTVLAFGQVGYENYRDVQFNRNARHLDGLALGGGVEVKNTGPTYFKAEYRYTDFSNNVGSHAGLLGFGFRF